MGGDGLSGMAMAIAVMITVMIAVPGLIGAWLGYRGLRTRTRRLGLVLGFVIGAGAGAWVATATFFERTWSPPPTLAVAVPPAFDHEWVIVIADTAAPKAIAWTGMALPFMSPHGRVDAPPRPASHHGSGCLPCKPLRVIPANPSDAPRIRTMNACAGRRPEPETPKGLTAARPRCYPRRHAAYATVRPRRPRAPAPGVRRRQRGDRVRQRDDDHGCDDGVPDGGAWIEN
jgi:hypothetical protein